MRANFVTVAALYGAKPEPVITMIQSIQAIVEDQMGRSFQPYMLEQVHGTLVGLDGRKDSSSGEVINEHFLNHRGEARVMDHGKALTVIAEHLTPPMPIRVGGFLPEYAPFTSRGGPPYLRSFTCQGNALVLMGWPVETEESLGRRLPLDDLRRAVNDSNILHRYHRERSDIDNDFYMVLGHVSPTRADVLDRTVEMVREHVALHPTVLAIGVEDVRVVAADTVTLYPAQFVGRLPLEVDKVRNLY
jgi:hypothetical protein